MKNWFMILEEELHLPWFDSKMGRNAILSFQKEFIQASRFKLAEKPQLK